MTQKDKFKEHLEMNKKAWDEYHPAWMEFKAKRWPDYYRFYADGGVHLDPLEKEMIGDVRGLRVLELSCGGDAEQAFSLGNLGAIVTACDISPVAIDIARENARRTNIEIDFVVCDSQTLDPIEDNTFDLVFAQYNYCYYEDLPRAFSSWYRVLRNGGRLFVRAGHPVTTCLEECDGKLTPVRSYYDKSPEYYNFNGTAIANEFGGWHSGLRAVEFFHSLSDIINAMIQAGFHIEKMMEGRRRKEHSGIMSKLPEDIFVTAHKKLPV